MRALVMLILEGEEMAARQAGSGVGKPTGGSCGPVKGRFLLANRHNLPFSAKNLFPPV